MLAAGAAGVTAALAGQALDRRDRRAIAADPELSALAVVPAGRPVTVVSGDGTTLHAEVHGPDHGPTVVLAHGWMCSSAVWRRQVRALDGHVRVVTYDQRGHGRTPPASHGDYSGDALAADLAAVLDQVVPRGAHVVVAGHSMGAMAVVAWAHMHRREVAERIAGAALINVGVEQLVRRSTIVAFPPALSLVRTAIGKNVLAAPLVVPSRFNPVVYRLARAISLGPEATPAQAALCTDMFLDCRTEARAGFGATLATLDLAHALPALTVPTVVIAGRHDRLTPPVHAREAASVLADATLVELSGAGHMIPIEAPGEVTDHLRRLVAGR